MLRTYLAAPRAARGKSISSSPTRNRSAVLGSLRARHSSTAHRSVIEPLEERHLLSATVIQVTTTQDIVDPNDDFISLREAILMANGPNFKYDIQLPAGSYLLTRQGANENAGLTGDLDIAANAHTRILGAGSDKTTIDGAGLFDASQGYGDRIFDIHPGAVVEFQGLTLSHGSATSTVDELGPRGGGAIRATNAEVTVWASRLRDNDAVDSGGGIVTTGGSLTIGITELLRNYSPKDGGAVYSDGDLQVTHATFSMNSADRGGGLYAAGTTLVNEQTTFRENKATTGGAIAATGEFSLLQSKVLLNTAATGGGIYGLGGTIAVTDSTLSTNHASYGGAIAADTAALSVQRSNLSGNYTDADGGAIFARGPLNVASSLLLGNNAGRGGAIFWASAFNAVSGQFALTDSTLLGNQATLGGGAYIDGTSYERRALVSGSEISENTATQNGGGFYIGSHGIAVVDIVDSRFSENAATNLGGGIFNTGILSLTRTEVVGNRASGLFNFKADYYGIANIQDSRFLGNFNAISAGAIESVSGTLAVVNTVFEENVSGGSAGAIQIAGPQSTLGGTSEYDAVIDRSTFANNVATDDGGAIGNFNGSVLVSNCTLTANQAGRRGGGIYTASDSQTQIVNTTITANTARQSGGGVSNLGHTTVRNATIVLNQSPIGGGISGTIDLRNTIVAGNRVSADPDAPASDLTEPAVPSLGSYNLIGDPNSAGGLTNGVNGNIVGDGSGGVLDIHTVLDTTLADNGGPTLTHALVHTGPAVNNGDPAFDPAAFDPSLDFDQRGDGYPRVLGGRIDIGAFETEADPLPVNGVITVTTFDDIVAVDGLWSLREAVLWANAHPEDNEIVLPAGTCTLTRQGANEDAGLTGDLDITANGSLRIWGNWPRPKIDASGLYDVNSGVGDRIFDIHENANVTIEYVELSHGSSDTAGGAVRVTQADVSLVQAVLQDNSTAGNGGAVFVSPGSSLSVELTTFSANSAGGFGGAIYSQAQFQDTRSRFEGNTAEQGGAIYYTAAEAAVLSFTTFMHNSASENGGAIYYAASETGVFSGATFLQNSASEKGGAIAAFGGIELHESLLGSNTAAQGGAIYGVDTHIDVLDGTVSGNGADLGGGLMSVRGSVHVDGTFMAGNIAIVDGGAIHASGVLDVQNATFTGNLAQSRGGAIAWTTKQDLPVNASLQIDNCQLLLNQGGYGGALLVEMRGDVLEEWNAAVENSRFSENHAGTGGAISILEAQLSVLDSVLSKNVAYVGGAIYTLGSRTSVERSTFTENEATDGDGAAIHHEQGRFREEARAHLTIAASEFTHNSGRALDSTGWLEVTTSSFTENTWGAIALDSFPATITDCVISRNTADEGGGIFAINNVTAIDDLGLRYAFRIVRTTISENTATGWGGGGISTQNGMLIEDCTFENNLAPSTGNGRGVGAGILLKTFGSTGVLEVHRSTFTGNRAYDQGGAIYANFSFMLKVADSSFTHNSAYLGGAIWAGQTGVDIVDSQFSQNSAVYGGAISGGIGSITHSSLTLNTAEWGGAIYGSLAVVNSTIVSNVASESGGGVYGGEGGIRGSTISGNRAPLGGGVFFTSQLPSAIEGSTISDNAAVSGGGIYAAKKLEIVNSTLSGNEADDDGGALYAGADVTIRNSTITLNRADADGDGAGQGGGLSLAGGATGLLAGSIVVGNDAGVNELAAPSDIALLGGSLKSASSFNLIGDPATAGGLTPGSNGNLVGDGSGGPIAVQQVLDTTLKDNGGPTLTHALLASSPAINAGDPNFAAGSLPFDQRSAGYQRVIAGRVDMGAVEYGSEFESQVTGRHLFYEYSANGYFIRGINVFDFAAIDPTKHALLPDGSLADSSNISGYSRGINGVMVDLAGSHPDISADDFVFRVGTTNDPDSWAAAPAPAEIEVYAGQGVGGADRIVILWPDGTIVNTYLQVIVAANEHTGLEHPDVFFFGNRVGDSFSTQPPGVFATSLADELAVRNASPNTRLDVSNPYDFDKDGKASLSDILIARNNAGLLPRLSFGSVASAESLAPLAATANPSGQANAVAVALARPVAASLSESMPQTQIEMAPAKLTISPQSVDRLLASEAAGAEPVSVVQADAPWEVSEELDTLLDELISVRV